MRRRKWIPCPMWVTARHTQDSKSSRWPGDYSPSIPTLLSPDGPLKLYLCLCHSSTVRRCVCWTVCPYLLSLPMASGGLQNAFSYYLHESTPGVYLALQNKKYTSSCFYADLHKWRRDWISSCCPEMTRSPPACIYLPCSIISPNAISSQYKTANYSIPFLNAFIPLLIAI